MIKAKLWSLIRKLFSMKFALSFWLHSLAVVHCKSDKFNFIKDVYNELDYKCATIVVDDMDTIDYEMIAHLVKSEHMVIQIQESISMVKSSGNKSSGSGCAVFVIEDFNAMLQIKLQNNTDIFKIHNWYILVNDEDKWTLGQGIWFKLDSNVFLVNFKKSDVVKVTEMYHINGIFFSNFVGAWTNNAGLRMSDQDKLERRSDLGGTVLRAIFLEETGYTRIAEKSSKLLLHKKNAKKVSWVGLVPDIFNSLAATMNFSYKLSQPRDGNWGAIDEEGSWNGMIRDLIDDVADIAPASLSVTQARTTAADFVAPFQVEMNSFFIGRQSSSYSFDIFYKSFSKNTWLTLFVFIVMMSLMIYYIARRGSEKYFSEFSLPKCFIFVYGAYGGFSSRRWSVSPSNISARIAFIFVVVFGALNHWHWKASIISHLSVIENKVPFRNLEELVRSSYQVTTLGDSFFQAVWEKGNSSIYQKVWKTKFKEKPKSLKDTEKEVILQALSGPYAIYLFHTTLTNLPEYRNCLLEGTNLLVDKVDLAFALQRNSPYLDLFNHAMQRIIESGELERIHRKHRVEEPACNDPGKGKPIGFENILLVFLILGSGTFVSIVICILEVCFKKNVFPTICYFFLYVTK